MQKFFINVRILDEEVLKATSKQQIDEILLKLEDYEKDLYDIYLFGSKARFYLTQENAINTVRADAAAQLVKIENKTIA